MPTENQFDEMDADPALARRAAKLALAKQLQEQANPIRLSVANSARKTPATLVMLTPLAAWHHLCAKTGASISLVSFYRWIRNGRVCAIRMGRKFYVPVQILDE